MDIKNKPTLEEKQAFWAEQLPNFESIYWLPSHFEFLTFDMEQGNYVIKDDLDQSFEDDATEIWHRVNSGWAMWKKAINFSKQQSTPEGSDLRFEQEDDAVWVFNGDSHQGTEISHLITSHIDDYNEDDVRLICHYSANEIDRLRAKLAQAIPEGFVLVPKDQITCFWQDNDEPENFCSNESDFDCLGDCIDLGEIIEINKFTQAHVNKEKLFGTWFAEAIYPFEKANFFVGTHAECLEIVAKNKAMIEAQELNRE